MEPTGYAIVPIDDVEWTDRGSGGLHAALTDRLGGAETRIDGYRTRSGASIGLPPDRERLCVPVGGRGTLTAGEPTDVDRSSIALAPAGTEATLCGETTWLVVSAPAEASPDAEPAVIDVEDLDFRVPATSDVRTARLTDRLGCLGMKVNVRRLRPGDVVPYHTEGSQEELFVPLDGDGTVRVDGETYAAPRWSVTRVAPDVQRSTVNPGTAATDWLMVGAPPTGGTDGWDPGAEIHEWPGSE